MIIIQIHQKAEPELSSDKGNEGVGMNVFQHYTNSTGPPENFDSGVSMNNLSIDSLSVQAQSIEELQSLNFYYGSPDSNPTNPGVFQVDGWLDFVDTSDVVVSNVKKHPESGSSEQRTEQMRYDRESLTSNGAELSNFTAPNGSDAVRLIQKPLEPLSGFSPTIMAVQNHSNNMQIVDHGDACGQHEAEEPSSHHPRACELDERQKSDMLTCCSMEDFDNEWAMDYQMYSQPFSSFHRHMLRHYLDFETVGILKNLGEGNCSSMISHDNENLVSNNKSAGSSSHVVNGVGLHFNALATSSKGYKDVNHGNLLYRRQLSSPISFPPYPSITTEEEHLLASAASKKDAGPSENGVQIDKYAYHASAYVVGEDFNQNTPNKKRCRGQSRESMACKRCKCKKSKCLKLYCECFAAGVYCIEPCSCQECYNKPIHGDTVLATRKQIESHNPLAFAPKVIQNSEHGNEPNKTPSSARHKRGCNCKKSTCLKKYCECFQSGVGCSISCRCEGCKNSFGRKDGAEQDGEETKTEASVKRVVKKLAQKNEEPDPGFVLPSTPLQLCRPMVPLPFSLGSSFIVDGSYSGLYTGQKLENPNILQPQLEFDKQMKTVSDNEIEIPAILQVDSFLSLGVKCNSPNNKRVCPPHSGYGSSPRLRTGRKLILESIPSSPSQSPALRKW